ncbi:MAG: hypothetical protein ACFFD8_10080, partial [Candidatus Thorarchaeota archaeon]
PPLPATHVRVGYRSQKTGLCLVVSPRVLMIRRSQQLLVQLRVAPQQLALRRGGLAKLLDDYCTNSSKVRYESRSDSPVRCTLC